MAKAPARQKLTLSKLEFLSLVDVPAQATADIRLIKRDEPELFAHIVKIDESNASDPLLWCWAFTSTLPDGSPYHDRQGDAITQDFIRVAEEFIKAGGPVDDLHDGEAKSRIAFAFPWDQDIASAMLGPDVAAANKTVGLMVAIRPTPDQLAKARDKTYTGVSIAGSGIREAIKSVTKATDTKCAKCSSYMKAGAEKCASCGTAVGKAADQMKCPGCGAMLPAGSETCPECGAEIEKAVWSAAEQNNLPDSSFLHIESGGEKDDEGKTTPRSLRHFPYKDSAGKVDLPHLRNAIARIPQSDLGADLKDKLQARAQSILDKENGSSQKRGDVAKYGDAASNASKAAYRASSDATTSSQLARASALHSDAAKAHADAGNQAMSAAHAAMANQSRVAAAGARAKEASAAAKDGGVAANQKAAVAHQDAADAYRGYGDSKSAQYHSEQAASHADAGRSASKRFSKQVVLTSVTDGHQHQIDLNSPCSYWSSQLSTSPATSEGADQPHCHAWVYDDSGKITIATDSGHDHTVSEAVPADVIAEAKERDEDPDDGKCAVPCAVEDEDSGATSGPTVVVVQARAPESNSPPSDAGTSVDNEAKEHRPMSTDALQIMTKRHEDLEKRNVFLEKFILLTDSERDHYNKLVGQDKEVFLSKSALERQVEISELAKADEVVYTSPITGEVYRKSSNPRELKLQKQADEATLAHRVEAQKRADDQLAVKGDTLLSAFAKGAKGTMRMRLMKAINAEFTDPTDYEEVVEALKGMNVAMLEASKPKGVTPKTDVSEIADPNAQLNMLAKKYEADNKVSFAKAYEAVLNTDTGKALYAAADQRARA